MTNYVGRRATLGLAVEAIRGTATVPTFYLPYKSLSIDDKAVAVVQDTAFGQLGDSDETYITKKYGEGDIEFDMEDLALGAILSAVMGASPSSTGPTTFTHAYTLADTSNQHKALSLLIQDPNGSTIFPMSMVDTFEITVEPEGLVNCKVGFRSRKGKDWGTVTPVYTTLGNKFLHQHLEFRVDTTITGLATIGEIDLRGLTLTIEKAPVDWDDIGTVSANDILNRQISVSGHIDLAYGDRTWRDYFLKETALAVEIFLSRATNSSLKIQLPKVKFQSWEPSKDLDEIAVQGIDFKAHYDAANAQKIIHLCNLINTYAGTNY